LFGVISASLTTYWAPSAAGSGVAELIGYLNGVNYPGFIGIPTLITKIFGVSFAVSGKLCVGKEGPLAHIGANVGLLALYLPCFNFKFL
jgi:chloride channel 7